MAQFEKINIAKSIKKNGLTVVIYKFRKAGTQRTFFAPEFENKRLNKTMFARLYSAEKLAASFLNYKLR